MQARIILHVFIGKKKPAWLTRFILGAGFETAIPILRILAFIAPITALSSVLGNQWLLPLGLDISFTISVWTAAIINLIGVALLTPVWQQNGMAVTVVIAEITFVAVSLFVLWRRGYVRKLFAKPSK